MKVLVIKVRVPFDKAESVLAGMTPTNDAAQAVFDDMEQQVATATAMRSRKDLTNDMIAWAMVRHKGNTSAAARFLRVPRTTLRCALDRNPGLAPTSMTQ